MTQKFKHPLKLMIVLGWAIAISLYSASPTFAKDRNVPTTVPTTKSRVENQSRPMTRNSEKVRIVRVKLISPDGKELTNLSPAARKKMMASLAKHFKEAGASAVTFVADTACFNECVGNLGATPIQLIMCGSYCGMWEDATGRLFCALCLGLDGMSVNGCAFQCGALLD